MGVIRLPEGPGGFFDPEAGTIRTRASGVGLALPAVHRANWLLGLGQGVVFSGAWPTSVEDLDSRIYHRRSENCDSIGVLALIESAGAGGSGSLAITPSGGAAVTYTHDDVATTDPWTDPTWAMWIAPIGLTDTGLAYHTLVTSNLRVRRLLVWELSRDTLYSAASDVMCELRDGAYTGFEGGRMITEGATGGLADLYAAIISAADNTRRHPGGFIFPDAAAWAKCSKDAWGSIGAAETGMSAFYWPTRARKLRSGTTEVAHEVRVRARLVGTGDGDLRLRSGATGDSVSFTSLGAAWGWYAPDGAELLDIDCAGDELYPEVYCDALSVDVEVASIQVLPPSATET